MFVLVFFVVVVFVVVIIAVDVFVLVFFVVVMFVMVVFSLSQSLSRFVRLFDCLSRPSDAVFFKGLRQSASPGLRQHHIQILRL